MIIIEYQNHIRKVYDTTKTFYPMKKLECLCCKGTHDSDGFHHHAKCGVYGIHTFMKNYHTELWNEEIRRGEKYLRRKNRITIDLQVLEDDTVILKDQNNRVFSASGFDLGDNMFCAIGDYIDQLCEDRNIKPMEYLNLEMEDK